MSSTSRFLFLMITMVSVCFSLCYYFDVQTKKNVWQKLNEEEQALQKILNQMNAEIKQQPLIFKKSMALKQKLKLYQQVDNKSEMTALAYRVIFQDVERTGLKVKSFKPVSWITKSPLTMFTLKMVVTGTYNQCINFMVAITQTPLPIALLDFTWVVTDDLLLKLEMDLAAYFIPGGIANLKNLSNETVTHVKRDPFVSEGNAKRALLSIPLQTIQWVGYIADENQFCGVVLLPNHKAFSVFPGDVLALEKARVVQLDEKVVWLELNGKPYRRHYYLKEKYGL